MKHVLLKGVIALLVVVSGTSFSTNTLAQKRLTVVTGPTGGVYFPLGGAVAKVLTSSLPDTTATHEATSASADNIRMVVAGKADIAFTQADTAWDAYKGYGTFQTTGSQPIRAIAVLYANYLQLVTRRDAGINRVADLRGKRVSLGAKGSGTEIWGSRLLLASGVDPDKDITRSSLAVGPSAEALKKGEIDAFVWSGGLPTKAIAELSKDPGIKIQLLNTAAAVPNMLRRYGPVYTDSDIVAGTYTGMNANVPAANVWNLLVVHADTDPKLVYDVLKALFDNKPELIAGHAEAKNIELTTQARGGSPIPFHDGAKRFYREKGVRILR
jgi:TRAP transporter TAXI family solute receptor